MRLAACFLMVLMLTFGMLSSAHAGLLGSLGRLADNAGDAGSAARKVDGIGGTDLPASALRAAKDPNTTPLALAVDPDGTLRLTDELGRAVDLPAGGDLDAALKAASNGAKQVAVVVDPKALARAEDVATALAERGVLKLWYGKQALPMRVSERGLAVEVREGLLKPVGGSRSGNTGSVKASLVNLGGLREVTYALNKTLNRGTIVVAEFGKTAKGPRRVGFGDGPSGVPGETVTVTRDDLLAGFSGNRGGTVILSGRVQDGAIQAKGGAVPLVDVRAAASAADVHLVVLDGPARMAHKALERATTYGDLLSGLSPKNGPMVVNASPAGTNRVRMTMVPEIPIPATPVVKAPTATDDVVTVVATGVELGVRSAIHSIEFETRDRSHEQDLSMRLIPGVPYWITVLYLMNLVFGLYGGRYAWRFWRRIWPMAPRPQRIALAHVPRFLVYLLVLLPATGLIWAVIAFFAGIGNTIMAVLRLIGLAKRKPA